MMPSINPFKELTWVDLMLWTDKKTVTEGRVFFQKKKVRQLALTPTGGILAWVDAEELFATQVEYSEGDLIAECTCQPVEAICMHAIAVIIEYIAHLKKQATVPMALPNDVRFFLL
jgi:uncharacterized Zn finger protein